MRWIKGILFGLVAIIGTGFIYQTVATKLDERRYPPIGERIDIGGYSLHLLEMGKEGPVVILESGLGGTSLDWAMVQPALAQVAQVYSYDRAGLGWSDESPLERTSENMVEELHELLVQAQIEPPYILVGHSLGGGNVRLFANRYPEEVAAVVLVDPSHEDQFALMPKFPQPPVWLARVGLYRLLSYKESSREMMCAMMGRLPSEVKQIKQRQSLSLKSLKTSCAEYALIEKSLEQLKSGGGDLGSRPLRLITACRVMETPLVSQEEIDAFHAIYLDLQHGLLSKSTNSRQLFAEESDHMVPYHQPELIVEAVCEVIQ